MISKIMLVMDEYQDMMAFETLFKKLGFDVLGINKELKFSESVLSFHPELIVAPFKSRSIDGLRLASRAARLAFKPKVALTYPSSGKTPEIRKEEERIVDALLTLPLAPEEVIAVIAQLGNEKPDRLLKKWNKIAAQLKKSAPSAEAPKIEVKGGGAKEAKIHVKGSSGSGGAGSAGQTGTNAKGSLSEAGGAILHKAREDRYAEFLKTVDAPVDQTLSHQRMVEYMHELKEAAKADAPLLEKIQAEKEEFVKALYKKTK